MPIRRTPHCLRGECIVVIIGILFSAGVARTMDSTGGKAVAAPVPEEVKVKVKVDGNLQAQQ